VNDRFITSELLIFFVWSGKISRRPSVREFPLRFRAPVWLSNRWGRAVARFEVERGTKSLQKITRKKMPTRLIKKIRLCNTNYH
jgi:hypothetical protein